MNMRRVLTGTVVLGILANVIDYVLHTYLIGSWWAGLSFVNPEPAMMWLVIGDFAAAFMLMLAWDKVGSAFGTGAKAGMTFGCWAGAFISFPATIFWQLFITDFPYPLAWKMVIVSVIWYGVLGAVAAMLDRKPA